MNVSRLINSTFVLGGRIRQRVSRRRLARLQHGARRVVGHVVLNTWQFSVLVWHSVRRPVRPSQSQGRLQLCASKETNGRTAREERGGGRGRGRKMAPSFLLSFLQTTFLTAS